MSAFPPIRHLLGTLDIEHVLPSKVNGGGKIIAGLVVPGTLLVAARVSVVPAAAVNWLHNSRNSSPLNCLIYEFFSLSSVTN